MGSDTTTSAFLSVAVPFAGSTLPRLRVFRVVGWTHVLSGVSIVALFLSIAFSHENVFKRDLIHRSTLCASISTHVRMFPRRSWTFPRMMAFPSGVYSGLAPRAIRRLAVGRLLKVDSRLRYPVSNHSPPHNA